MKFTLYHFKFWRYLFVSVSFMLLVIFGSLESESIMALYGDDGNALYLILSVAACMALGIFIGIKVSTYTYTINTNEQGLQMSISPPQFLGIRINKSYGWEELGEGKLETYYNGEILRFNIRTTGEKYTFMNSVLRRSKDMPAFWELLKNRIEGSE